MTRPVLAADVGGTQMRAALVDVKGRILLRRSAPTPAEADVPAVVDRPHRRRGGGAGHGAASHAVVGLPGGGRLRQRAGSCGRPTSPRNGPTSCRPTGLTAHLGLPVSIANDADLAAVGEAWFGAGAESSAVAYLTISTGIGAGVVHGGRLLRGTRSLAEVGHIVIDWRAWRDGGPSHARGAGVGQRRRPTGPRGRTRVLGAREDPGTARQAGEPRAAAIWQQAIAACAAGVSNLGHVLLPEHRRHRRRDGQAGRILRPAPRHGAAAARSPPRRPGDRPLHPRRRCRAVRGGGLGRRHRAPLTRP